MSPHPWGSHTAEGFRKSAGLDRIVTSLFNNAPEDTPKKRLAFSAGSHVLWTPVYVRPDGELKHAKPISGTDEWAEGWLASRSPPYRGGNGSSGLEIDITSLILDKKPFTDLVEVLYDNRFLSSFNLHAVPDQIFERLRSSSNSHRLVVTATGKYFLPRLVLRSSSRNTVEDIDAFGPNPDGGSTTMVTGSYQHSVGATGWANWRLVRPFE